MEDRLSPESYADSTTEENTLLKNNSTFSNPSSNYLPPCRICHRKASGFHYGVNTCEACKGFYRRSIRKFERSLEIPYKCEKDLNCQIEMEKIMCSYCRYQRCLSAGMSKQAIKQGRYTHARKAQYTIEIKGGIGQADPEHVKVEPVPSISDEIDEDELNGTLQALVAIEEKFDPGFREQFQNLDFFHQKQKEVFLKITEKKKKRKWNIEKQCIVLPNIKDVLKPKRYDYPPFENRETVPYTDEKNIILEIVTSGLDEVVRYLVEFVKSIPGFRELSISDQSSLLKASFLEFGFIGDCYKFNPEMKVMLGIIDMPVDKLKTHEIFPNNDIPDNLLKFSKKMQQLMVTCDEITLMRGILILFTDRCDLENPTKISDIQWKLVQYLQHITRHAKNRFPILLGQLTYLRSLQLELVLECLNNFKANSAFMNRYPVVQEVISMNKS